MNIEVALIKQDIIIAQIIHKETLVNYNLAGKNDRVNGQNVVILRSGISDDQVSSQESQCLSQK